jgi:hypothetical protein
MLAPVTIMAAAVVVLGLWTTPAVAFLSKVARSLLEAPAP